MRKGERGNLGNGNSKRKSGNKGVCDEGTLGKAGNKLVKSKIWVKREKGKWEKGILGKWERRQGWKCSGAWGSRGIKKIRKYGMIDWENLKKTFEYNINMFAFVQLTQLLHKFCAC